MQLRYLLFLLLAFTKVSSIGQNSEFKSFINQINILVEDSNYTEASKRLKHEMNTEKFNWFDLSKELIFIHNKQGLFLENLEIFKQAHKKGYFYFIHPRMKEYAPYLELQGFNEISSKDLELLKTINEASHSTYIIQLPNEYHKNNEYPLIMLLHGGGKNIKDVQEKWQVGSLNSNFIKVFIQSYRHFDSNTYGWLIDEKQTNEFLRIYQEIKSEYLIDTANILIGGISAGATVAIEMALKSVIPVKGFIAYCPSKPAFIQKKQFDKIKNFKTMGYLAAGENDFFIPRQKQMISILDSLKINYKYTIIKNHGHEYPKNEEFYINDALKYFKIKY